MEHQYDFTVLAQKYTYLRPYLNGNKFDFSHHGLGQLTRAILKEEFELEFEPLENKLCPTIPSRLAYLDHINQILKETQHRDNDYQIKGLDIGTGAYAIYAVLGYKKYGWKLHGSDIDHESIGNAMNLVQKNNINDVKLHKVSDKDDFYQIEDGEFDFTMCNPPFYGSKQEMIDNMEFKESLARDEVIASESELITQGGEVEFVSKMVRQSLGHGDDIQWFSSLLGKKQSLEIVINVLKEVNCNNFLIRDYKLGKTKRWILFWSFQNQRPRVANDYKLITPTIVSFDIDLEKVELILKDYLLECIRDNNELIVTTNGDVWSRSFRRKKQKPNEANKSIFKINGHSIYWSFGPSITIFQSFHTFIKKKIS